jgi:Glycosyl transferase family 2
MMPEAVSPTVDVVIDNHDYGRYLGAAIDSALAQTYDGVSVIVVDDGSTDDSREVIASFGDRIESVLKENGGQASAFNAGLERSHGDVVLFLDADDILTPHAAERVAAAFRARPELAKVHFRLAVVDESGRPTGEVKPSPHIALPQGDLKAATLRFPFDLARPATSGNAFSRRALRALAPVRDCGDHIGADWYVVHLSALLGPVGAIDDALALYRLHGENLYENSAHSLDLDQIRATIGCAARTRDHLAELAHRLGLEQRPGDASMSEVADRAISLKLDPSRHPLAGDTLPGLVRLGVHAAHRRFDIALPMKAAFALWLAALATAPRPLARRLAELFVYPARRRRLNGWLKRMSGR